MDRKRQLNEHYLNWRDCRRCPLGERAYKHVLHEVAFNSSQFVRDGYRVDVLMVGEGPGNSEDILGQPFIGPAGKVLRQAIEDAGVGGLSICLTNLVACRPQEQSGGPDRKPTYEEIRACHSRLTELIEVMEPYAVVALGRLAGVYTYPTNGPLTQLLHPSYILRIGGVSSQVYHRYVSQLTEVFEWVKQKKEAGVSRKTDSLNQ